MARALAVPQLPVAGARQLLRLFIHLKRLAVTSQQRERAADLRAGRRGRGGRSGGVPRRPPGELPVAGRRRGSRPSESPAPLQRAHLLEVCNVVGVERCRLLKQLQRLLDAACARGGGCRG